MSIHPALRRSLRGLSIGVVVTVAVVTSAACDKSSKTASGGGSSAEAPATGAAGEAEEAKLAAAIECINRHSGRVLEVRDSYLGDVDDKGAFPAGAKPALKGLYGIDGCVDEIKKAGALTPAVPELDRALAAYATALQTLVTAYEELSGYYEKGEYLDDKGAKAATLHPKVMAAFEGFAAAHKALDGIVGTLHRARRIADLAAREKAEGRKLEVIIDAMMLEAETLVELVSAADSAALDAAVTAYGKLVDEVDAYAGAHADEAQERGSLANLKNYSKSFLGASKVVARKLRDKAKPTDSEQSDAVDQFNHLVDNYNNH